MILKRKNSVYFLSRIILDCLLLVSFFLFPSWITLVLIVVGAFFVKNLFWEGIVAGFFLDALYGYPHPSTIFGSAWHTFLATGAVFIIFFIRRKLLVR